MNVILARINGQVLHLPLLGSVVDDQRRLHEPMCHHKKGQATRDLPPGVIICIYELALIGLERVLDYPRDMVLHIEMKGHANLTEKNLVLIHKAEVNGLVWIDGFELNVIGID